MVVVGGPALRAGQRHLPAAVVRHDLEIGVLVVDPEVVHVTVRHAVPLPRRAAVDGLVVADVEGVHRVLVHRVGVDVRVVPGALLESTVVVHPPPRVAPVLGAVDAALVVGRLHEHPHAVGVGAGHGNRRLADKSGGESALEPIPRVAAVRRTKHAGLLGAGDRGPRLALAPPRRGEDDAGVPRVDGEIHGARGVGNREDVVPALPAIRGAKHAALGVGSEGVAQGGDEGHVRIVRVNLDAADLTRVREADVGPRVAAVGAAVDADPLRHVAADGGRAGAHIDDVRVAVRHVDRADGPGLDVAVRDVAPVEPRVVRAPHAAARRAHEIGQRLLGDPRHRRAAAAPRRPDGAEAESRHVGGVEHDRLLGGERRGRDDEVRRDEYGRGEGRRGRRDEGRGMLPAHGFRLLFRQCVSPVAATRDRPACRPGRTKRQPRLMTPAATITPSARGPSRPPRTCTGAANALTWGVGKDRDGADVHRGIVGATRRTWSWRFPRKERAVLTAAWRGGGRSRKLREGAPGYPAWGSTMSTTRRAESRASSASAFE